MITGIRLASFLILRIVIHSVSSAVVMYSVPNEQEYDNMRECYGKGKSGTIGIPFKILFRRSLWETSNS
jgi:hypothetical protein